MSSTLRIDKYSVTVINGCYIFIDTYMVNIILPTKKCSSIIWSVCFRLCKQQLLFPLQMTSVDQLNINVMTVHVFRRHSSVIPCHTAGTVVMNIIAVILVLDLVVDITYRFQPSAIILPTLPIDVVFIVIFFILQLRKLIYLTMILYIH